MWIRMVEIYMGIKVVSFDLYQTLVDVLANADRYWKMVVGEDCDPEEEKRGLAVIREAYVEAISITLSVNSPFYTMEEVYANCVDIVCERMNLKADHKEALRCILMSHTDAPFYPDALPCIEKVRMKYNILLCADSSHSMADKIIERIKPEHVFLSDDINSYKRSEDGVFFSIVLSLLNIKPDEMLHVGDSASDVVGAGRAGITTVWLNRTGRVWIDAEPPHYTIRSLDELPGILEKLEHKHNKLKAREASMNSGTLIEAGNALEQVMESLQGDLSEIMEKRVREQTSKNQ